MNNSVKYTNNPNNKAKSRIIFDKNDIDKEKDNLAKEGLYFIINIEDQIDTNYNMLIIGPQDSPYAGGYYMFDCQFPDQYPFFPMKVFSSILLFLSPLRHFLPPQDLILLFKLD